MAASICSRSRCCSASGISLGNLPSGAAKGEVSGAMAAIPSLCVTTFSSRNFGGIRPSAMPVRMCSIVWSNTRGNSL